MLLITDINDKMSANTKEINDIRTEQKRVSDIKIKASRIRTELVRKIAVQIATPGEVDYSLDITYTVSGARWSSNYVLRINSAQSTANLTYKSDIVNSTEEDWENVDLTLSTASPSKGGQPPLLPTFGLKIYQPPPPPKTFARKKNVRREKMSRGKMAKDMPPLQAKSMMMGKKKKMKRRMSEEKIEYSDESSSYSESECEDDFAISIEEEMVKSESSVSDLVGEVFAAEVSTSTVQSNGTSVTYKLSR